MGDKQRKTNENTPSGKPMTPTPEKCCVNCTGDTEFPNTCTNPICVCHLPPQTESGKCYHQCSGNCRRVGCNCECGEWHCPPDGKCMYEDEGNCPNHPTPPQAEWDARKEAGEKPFEPPAQTTCLSSDCPERTGGKCNAAERNGLAPAEKEWEKNITPELRQELVGLAYKYIELPSGCDNCWGDLHLSCTDDCRASSREHNEKIMDFVKTMYALLSEQRKKERERAVEIVRAMKYNDGRFDMEKAEAIKQILGE